jgi:fumarate reductase subunit C
VGEEIMKTKEYVRPMPATWWLHNYHLVLFMIRELTSVFVAGYAVFLMVLLYRVNEAGNSPGLFGEKVLDLLKSPVSIAWNLIVLVFALYHSITWFNLTPKAVILWRGEEKVSPFMIAGAHYAAWVLVSVLILLVVLTP